MYDLQGGLSPSSPTRPRWLLSAFLLLSFSSRVSAFLALDPCGLVKNATDVTKNETQFYDCARDFLLNNEDQLRNLRDYGLAGAYKAAIQRLWSFGRDDLAADIWKQATGQPVPEHGPPHEERGAVADRLFYARPRLLHWPSPLWTPTVFFPDTDHSTSGHYECFKLWPDFFEDLPGKLVKYHADLEDEVKTVPSSAYEPAFSYLERDGSWDVLWLYRNNKWSEEICDKYLTSLCMLVQRYVPSKVVGSYKEIVENRVRVQQGRAKLSKWEQEELEKRERALAVSEEVLLLRMKGRAKTAPHCGRSNSQVNIHFTLDTPADGLAKVGRKGYGGARLFADFKNRSFLHFEMVVSCVMPWCSAALQIICTGHSSRQTHSTTTYRH